VPSPEAAAATLADRVGTLEGRAEGAEESLAATRSVVDRLNKIKLSGYVQGRYEWHDDSLAGVSNTGVANGVYGTNRFLVRRARLKALYDGTNAEYMLQIDATGDGVALRDAEATFVDTWTPFGIRLTVGQFKWPFGYEVLQSSSDREMPERSSVIRALFPGERDRGLRLQARYEWLRFAAALVNGNGTQENPLYVTRATYGTRDPNTWKDIVWRIGGDFEWLVAGFSGYWGRTLKTTFDTGMPPAYQRLWLLRLGLDAQFYVEIPSVGGLAVKGELVYAKDSDAGYGGVPADSCNDITRLGWIVTVVQNIGDYAGAVLRIDSYDPNFSKAVGDSCPEARRTAGLGDRRTTVGGGLLVHASGNLKGTFVYEHLAEQSMEKGNDIFTAQLQARF
jgi:hypothetical protein